MTPRVSVIVTCYNYGRYLAACLDSALSQSVAGIELIVVDDGSTDESPSILERYAASGKIVSIRQQNAGQAAAKNAGARAAQGQFLAFLDADDRWERDKLERQLPLFDEPRVGVVFSRARFIDAADNDVTLAPLGPHLAPRRGRVSAALFVDNFVPFSSSVVRRDAFLAAGGFDQSLPMGIDWDLWLRLSVAFEFDYVDAPLLIYRVGHPGQMSKNKELRQSCSDRIMESFLARFPGAISEAEVRRARAHTWINRGFAAQRHDLRRSSQLFFRAIGATPRDWRPYKGLLDNALLALKGSKE